MSAKQPGSNLMSSAGIVRYFENEDQKYTIFVSHKSFLLFVVLCGLLIEFSHFLI